MGAERDVLYRLKVQYDQSGSQAFATMASNHAAAIKQIEDRWKAYDAAVKASAGGQSDAVGNSYKKQKNSAKEFYDYVGAENKKLVDAIKERERAEEMARRASERAMAQMKAGHAQLKEGFFNAAEGVTRVARGLTLMGFVNDENLQKLLKTLSVVQGTSDIILGSVKAYSALQKAVDGYTLAVNAAKAAEAARAGTTAAGSAGSAAAGMGGAGIGGTLLGATAAAAAIAGLTMVLVELAETANGTALEVDSFTSSVGRGAENFSKSINDWINDTIGGDFSGKIKTNTPFNDLQREVANAQLRDRLATSQLQYDRQQPFAMEASRRGSFDRMLALGGVGGASQAGTIGDEIARLQRQAGAIQGRADGSFGSDRQHYLGEAVGAQERILQLTKARADEEERIRQTSISYHQNAIAAAQQELAIVQQQQEALGNRVESARDRFGAMNRSDQSRLLALGKLANQANALRGAGNVDEARRIEGRFTGDDLALLRGVGLEGTDNFTGRVYGERADRAGFSGVFGGEERKRAEELAPRIESLVAETTVNVEARFKLELDREQASEAFRAAAEPILKELSRLAAEQTQLRLTQEKQTRDTAARQARSRQGG